MKKYNIAVLLCSTLLVACSTTQQTSNKNIKSSVPQHRTDVHRVSASGLTTNEACIHIIKEYEGVRLKAYKGPGGHWLIGYGHKAGVKKGMVINMQRANEYLRLDLKRFEKDVARLVTVPVTRNEFSAMVCLSYNIGSGNFAKSTVRKQINRGNTSLAADAILMWNKAGGKTLTQLKRRRESDKKLFLSD